MLYIDVNDDINSDGDGGGNRMNYRQKKKISRQGSHLLYGDNRFRLAISLTSWYDDDRIDENFMSLGHLYYYLLMMI